MYRELFPLRQALSLEVKADLSPAGPGIDSEHLLENALRLRAREFKRDQGRGRLKVSLCPNLRNRADVCQR